MQYAGRLHRTHDNKHEVRIYDYIDLNEPMLLRMYKKGFADMRIWATLSRKMKKKLGFFKEEYFPFLFGL